MLHTDRRTLQNAVRNILDGELLNKYLYLSTMERSELAKKIGTTADIVSFILKKKTTPRHSTLIVHLLPVSFLSAPPLQILEDLLEIDQVTAHF